LYDVQAITNLAKAVLTVATPSGVMDTSLCDRAERLVRNVVTLCASEEVAADKSGVDMFCLKVATLFSDAGLARSLSEQFRRRDDPARTADAQKLLDLCEEIIEESLAAVLEPAQVRKIRRIMRESVSGQAVMREAMILSDARNLDDMGVTGIFNEFRRQVMAGKGVAEAIELWRMKMDYRYWEARLKDGFHFEWVRALARQRLDTAARFMKALEHEHTGGDMRHLMGNPPAEA
jgi:hypothetical protein